MHLPQLSFAPPKGGLAVPGQAVAILALFFCARAALAGETGPIDRHALVTRHNIVWNEPAGRLALGNGEFCFGADGTGLQTFAGNTMSHWGWHSFPLPAGWTPERVPATGTFQKGRNTGPDVFPEGTEAIRTWMFDNPHIMNLGRFKLRRTQGPELVPADLARLSRTLDLWSGAQTAQYWIDNQPVSVVTRVHPDLDLVAVRVESPLVQSGGLEITLDFPYPALKDEAWVGDFARAAAHATTVVAAGNHQLDIQRQVDETRYYVRLIGDEGCRIDGPGASGVPAHAVRLSAAGAQVMSFVCAFSHPPFTKALPTFLETQRAGAAHWKTFWQSGGAIDLSASQDPRWRELERRIVLSQYQMAAQSAGSWPSSEYGLLGIDPWRGQFHLEMTWWHLAHYALWDRWPLADNAVGCYARFAPGARALAQQLGYAGVKWQKSVGPEGRTAPWTGNQVLLWKQPHPIFFAELEYRLRPTRQTLEKWANLIQATAEHMADYPTLDQRTGCYSLSPAMPPSEQGITRDTVFDLAYWRWGLDKAQEWRQRLELPREPHWDEVRRHLAPLPTLEGVYIHSPEWTNTYAQRAFEHPDPIGVIGLLPPVAGVDRDTAQRTVRKVWSRWNWDQCWGWDFPWMAMAAARTGEPAIAVEALLKASPRNHYDIQGINTGGPCPYLPGNGGLLYAAAMLAAGWDGAPTRNAPGFPTNGAWTVRWEGLKPAP
jgi:hypothetical protein